MPARLTAAQLAHDLALTDLTDPSDGPHAIQLLVEAAVTALTGAWGCQARWCRGPRVVTIADNYDRLGYQAAAVTRDARLGARPGQRNLLVRVVLRHLERSLTDDEANSLRDRIYAAVHQGTRHQWAPRART